MVFESCAPLQPTMEAPGDVPNQQNMKMDKRWVISLFICIFYIAVPVENVMNESNQRERERERVYFHEQENITFYHFKLLF